MYNDIIGGKTVKIQGLKCNIPPVGVGCHTVTQDLKPVEIIKRSSQKSEQYWEAFLLPEDWDDKIELERNEKRILKDDDYTNPELDKIREREWHRRHYGIWVYMNGEPVYITGLFYFYLNYWQLDTGLPDFRVIDWEYFCFWQYCTEDPICYGMIEICKRRNGKTSRASNIAYEIISKTSRALGGIQSKLEKDAKDIFDMFIIPPFQQLPEFFIPVYDTSKGSTPKGELAFEQTSIKGKNATISLKKRQLKSRINYRGPNPKAYDGKKTKFLLLDESGKVEVDVIDRHLVVKKCLVDAKRKIVGKMIVTTTVEEMGIKFRFHELWNWSNQYHREDNGQTKSGLYQFFISADRSGGYDLYGNPYVKETLSDIMAERHNLRDSPRDLFAEIRKEPLSVEEAFKVSNNECHFNQLILEDIHSTLLWASKDFCIQGNFEWKDGKPFTNVIWKAAKNGRWFLAKPFTNIDASLNFQKRGATFVPLNRTRFACGCDPFQNSLTEDSRNSKGASHVKQRYSPEGVDSPFNKAYICMYFARPQLVSLFHEDMMMQCLYFGTTIRIENAKDGGTIAAFERSGMSSFLEKTPGKENYGVYPDENNKALALNLTNDFIESQAALIHTKLLMAINADQLIKFNIAKTEKTDAAMSILWTEYDDYHKDVIKTKVSELRDIKDYFRSRRVG